MANEEERNIFSNYRPSVRGRIVGLHRAGSTRQQIREELGCNIKTVNLWINKYEAGGDGALKDHRKNNKRPLKTTPDEDVRLCEAVEATPFTTIAAPLQESGVDISVSTARRRLKEVGLVAHRPEKKTALTEDYRQQRLRFAEEHVGWTPEQWAAVVWSDEKEGDGSDKNKYKDPDGDDEDQDKNEDEDNGQYEDDGNKEKEQDEDGEDTEQAENEDEDDKDKDKEQDVDGNDGDQDKGDDEDEAQDQDLNDEDDEKTSTRTWSKETTRPRRSTRTRSGTLKTTNTTTKSIHLLNDRPRLALYRYSGHLTMADDMFTVLEPESFVWINDM
ncbi:nucleolar transcription factor 1-B-like [Venturia canescens]|uniref:nucleolar transcription factor 1-B-like n=1 Tax=Venturia canescens TaxID=32260 RepID=UPI001C9C3E46|nr:nucleolar transcription factor 1-B-like [Venturia canescens]